MNLRFFKLTNGEEFIADLTDTTEHHIVVEQPVVLSMNAGNANFVLWCALRENRTFTLKQELIMFDGDVSDSLTNEYSRLFGSGIISSVPQGVASIRPKGQPQRPSVVNIK